MSAPFSLEENSVSDTVVLVAHGEVDTGSAPVMTEAIRRHRAAAARVVVDLRAVTFIDSTGLASIALNATEAEGQAPVQVIAPVLPQPVRLFELTGLQGLLTAARDAERLPLEGS